MRIALLFVCGLSFTAHAAPRVAALDSPSLAPPGLAPLADEPTALAPKPPPQGALDLAQARDAASDHGLAIGTAIPVPVGHVEITLRDASSDAFSGGMASIAGGLTRSLELDAEAGASFTGHASTYGVGLKIIAVRGRGFALALEGSYHKLTGDDVSGGELSSARRPFYLAGAKISGCFEERCSVLATFGISGVVLENTDADGGGSTRHIVIPLLSGSLLFGTGVARPFVEGLVSFGALGIMGVRLGGARLAVDVGVGGGMVGGGGGRGSTNALIGLTARL